MLTQPDLRELLLNDRHLALDHRQRLLEGLLDLSSACNDSRSEHQHQEHGVSPGKNEDLPSITVWRLAVASLAFYSTSSSFFF
jgi:hypothetical protein